MPCRLALFVGVGLVVFASAMPGSAAQGRRGGPQTVAGAQPSPPPINTEWLDLARKYLSAVRAHESGQADEAALRVARWPASDVVAVTEGLVDIAQALRDAAARDAKAGRPQPFLFRSRAFTQAQFRTFLGLDPGDTFVTNPNEMFKRGALLHMDIAMIVSVFAAPSPISRDEAGGTVIRRATVSVDGHVIDIQDNSLHWSHARRLLEAVAPSPSGDAWVRQWYLATAAWQADHKMWSVCLEHAANASWLFPTDARFAFARGVVHEVFALPRMQAAREGSAPGVEDGRTELGQAATFLRKALELDPSFAEAHLHYGHVLGGLGRYQEAERELKQAEAALKDPTLRYFATLFLGYVEGGLGARDAATASFERAAAAFPRAQSPLLGLSQVARQADDGPAATATLERLFALPRRRSAEDDPWWDYDRTHARDADALVTDVRRVFLPGAR